MLTGRQILEAIAEGRLAVEPLLKKFQVGACSLDIRIGTHFQLGVGPKASIERVRFGDSIVLPPSTSARFVTFEALSLAPDIVGLVIPRSVFSNIGLLVMSSQIDPGWRGKLVLNIFNLSGYPARLFVGQRVASVLFFEIEGESDLAYRGTAEEISMALDQLIDSEVLKPSLQYDEKSKTFSRFYRTGEYRSLSRVSEDLRKRISSMEVDDKENLQYQLDIVLKEKNAQKKGKLLEEFVSSMLSGINGLRIVKRNARLSAEEIDLIIQNHVNSTFWKTLGTPMIIECKNWKSTVGVDEINNLSVKMEALSPDVRTSILVSINGLSGDSYRDAQLRRRELRQKGRYILVLDRKDLDRIAYGESIVQIIEEKHDELYLI